MTTLRTSLLAAAVALSACGSVQPFVSASSSSSTACTESRDLACLTPVECALDASRGCQVCQCAPATRGTERAPAADQREAVPVVPVYRPDPTR